MTWRGEVGASYPCARQIGPPSPAHPAILARLAALRVGSETEMRVLFAPRCIVLPAFVHFVPLRVIPHSGAGAHGIARAGVSRSGQSLLAACGGRLTLERAQSEAASPHYRTRR